MRTPVQQVMPPMFSPLGGGARVKGVSSLPPRPVVSSVPVTASFSDKGAGVSSQGEATLRPPSRLGLGDSGLPGRVFSLGRSDVVPGTSVGCCHATSGMGSLETAAAWDLAEEGDGEFESAEISGGEGQAPNFAKLCDTMVAY